MVNKKQPVDSNGNIKTKTMAKYQKLKELLIQIQKENKSGNSKLLNEIKEHRNSDEYKISLEELAKEIMEESRYNKEYQQNRYNDKNKKHNVFKTQQHGVI